MAADIYGSQKTLQGVFNGSTTTFTVGGSSATVQGALTQNVDLRYDRSVSRIFELGSESQYYVIGQSQGQGQFGSILGPKTIISGIVGALSDPCSAKTNIVSMSATSNFCGDGGGTGEIKVECSGALLTSIGVSMNVQDFMVRQQGAFMFATMSVN